MRVKTKISILTLLLVMSLSTIIHGQSQLELGMQAFKINDFEGAIEYLNRYLETNPYSEQAYKFLVNSYLALGRSSEAVTALEKAIQHFPDVAEFYKLIGRLYTQEEKFEEARQSLEKYLELSPGDLDVERILSTICFNCGIMSAQKSDYFPALQYFDRAIELDSSYMEAYRYKAVILIETKHYPEAEHFLRKAQTRFPYNDIFEKAYFDVLIQQEKYREALPIMDKISQREPENVDVALQLAMLYRYLHEADKAMAIYDKLIDKFPRERKIYEAVIDYWDIFNRQDKIRQTYELMLKTFPDDLDIHLEIAKTYEYENKWQEAREKYNQLLKTYPQNADIYLRKANTFIKQDSLSLAIAAIQTITDFDKENYKAFKELGMIYDRQENYSSSLKNYKSMYGYYPDDYYAVYHLGFTYMNIDQPDSAEMYIKKARKISTSEPLPYFALAQIESGRGDIENALKLYKESLSRGIRTMSNLQSQAEAGFSSETGKIKPDQLGKYETLKSSIELIENIIEGSLEYLKANYSHDKFGDLLTGYLRLYPSSIFLYLYQAKWYLDGDDVKQAEASYKKVISLNPNIVDAHIGLAEIYESENDPVQAIRSYRRVLAIDDTNDTAYDGLVRVYDNQGKLDDLADIWLADYQNNPENDILRERLIEVLHKAKRMDEAKEIIDSVKNKEVEIR